MPTGTITPARFAELADLQATGRFQPLIQRLDELLPLALDRPELLPTEPKGLLDIVLEGLMKCGDFERALRFVDELAGERLPELRRRSMKRKLLQDQEEFGPLRTIVVEPGHVTTIARREGREISDPPFLLRYLLTGDRVDTKRCRSALRRMRRKMLDDFGADPGELTVELHNSRLTFDARGEELHGSPLPPHVEGLAAYARSTLLIFCEPTISLRSPHSIFQRLSHEYVHVAIRSLAGGAKIPAWLDEGLAITLTAELRRPLWDLWEERKAQALPLAALGGQLADVSAEVYATVIAQSTIAARALLEEGTDYVADGLRSGWSLARWAADPALEFMRRR